MSGKASEAPVGQRWLISGRVQGVGYRMWLEAEARALELDGWVRNLADGRVEAMLLGPADRLGRLEVAARRGPAMAVVERVEVAGWGGLVAGGGFRQIATATRPEDG